MRRNKSILTLFSVIQLAALSNGATISGTVSDTVATSLIGVKVILTGLSIPTFIDSTLTDADGLYTFNDISAATYRISLRFSGLSDKDSSIVMGNNSIVCNFILSRIIAVPGTFHSDIVGGTWLPEGNPHKIIDSAIIKDSLFIAPGCSVIVDPNTRFTVEGKLTVGSPQGIMTSINGGIFACNDSFSSISSSILHTGLEHSYKIRLRYLSNRARDNRHKGNR